MRQRGKILILLGAAGLLASSAGAGFYQRTLDSNALVWNDQRQSGEEATWSGRKDAQGYATGYGTLTWYSRGKLEVTGSSIPSRRRFGVVATYYGNMVRGKFLQRGKSAAAATPGARTPSPKPRSAPRQAAIAKTPSPAPSRKAPASTPAPAATATPADTSLNALTHPPASLQLNTPAPSPQPTPQQNPPF